MNPERLTVTLRPRSALEAIDLGFAMVQTHARVIWRAWLYIVLPVMLLLALLEHALPTGGWLLWWAKPFYDVVVLLVLSHAVFGERPGIRALLASLRAHAAVIAGSLTLRRLSISRSFLLPAHLLEGLHGPAQRTTRRARLQLLREGTTAMARLLTFACICLEMSVVFGLLALLAWLLPELHRDALFGSFNDSPEHLQLAALQLLYMLTISLVEPFYVAAGFALYLNRRTQLESWDIEVALRRLAARMTARTTATDNRP